MTVRDTGEMIRGMAPVLAAGRWSFDSVTASPPDGTIATIAEDEGLSVVRPARAGDALPMRRITLTVVSALDGVGLTAAVSGALAAEGIACNIVAGHHHDHIFVPETDADRALGVLRDLAGRT